MVQTKKGNKIPGKENKAPSKYFSKRVKTAILVLTTHPEVFPAGSSQLVVVASIMVDTSLRQHSIVLDLGPCIIVKDSY